MDGRIKVEIDPDAEKILTEMFRQAVLDEGVEITCRDCGEKFTMVGESTKCPNCGLEYRLG